MKIEPKHFTISPEGKPYVLDSEGRMWAYNNGQWHIIAELPDEPTLEKRVVNLDLSGNE